MRLRPEHYAEYCRRHDEIWPELSTLLSNAGISDYAIYIDDAHETLTGTFKCRDEALLDALPHHPVMRRWWGFMAPLMETHADNSPVQKDLQRIFLHDPPAHGAQDPFDPAVLSRVMGETPRPQHTISYTASCGKDRKIEIFRPANLDPDLKLPALVLFHGGGWRIGCPQDIARQAYLLSQLGMVVLAPEYAVTQRDGSTPMESLADAFLAWEAICGQAGKLAIDPARLAAGGSSAGGHLAAALANLDPPQGCVPARRPGLLVLFEPVVDNGPGGYGYDRVSEYWERFSPLHNIGAEHPPTLMIVGEKDELMPPATAWQYCRAVQQGGGICELEIYPDTAHGWFQGPGFAVTTKAALSFVRRHFL